MSKPKKKVKDRNPRPQNAGRSRKARRASPFWMPTASGDEANLDLELARIRQAAEDEINAAAAQQDGIAAALEAWATKNPAAFGKKENPFICILGTSGLR